MTIGETTTVRQAVEAKTTTAAAKEPGSETAGARRELEEAVRSANETGALGPSSELQFAIDKDSGKALIRIVDRVTSEVIVQLPSENALRAAEVLKSLKPGDRIA